MSITRRAAGCSVLALVGAVAGTSCGSQGNGSNGSAFTPDGGGGADASSSSSGGGHDATAGDAPSFGGGDAQGCTTSADCDGGACVSGLCCADAAHVCNGVCCTGGSVCLFDQCVTPGAACQTSDQCGQGQYCEPALGPQADAGAPSTDAGPATNDAGSGTNDAGSATNDAGCTSLAVSGRCLPIPPSCAGDAGASPDGGFCLASCEYHPPHGGSLSATVKWAWGPTAKTDPDDTDVWSTPTVGRMYDTNCDGKIDSLDSPVIVFVSGNVGTTCCGCNSAAVSTCENGLLRMLNGSTGEEIWTLAKASASSVGFMGSAPALGDVDKDGVMDIVAMTGEGAVVLIDHLGNVKRTSDKPYPHTTALGAGQGTGWGGGLAIADMDLDGYPEIAFGDTVWTTTNGSITRVFVGGQGTGGGSAQETSAIADLDLAPDGHLELVAGNTAYKADGTVLWTDSSLPNGFPAVADLNKDGKPEVILVGYPPGNTTTGAVWVLEGATGKVQLGPLTLPSTSGYSNHGGPPTVADFDGNGLPEIGVAGATYYTVIKPDYTKNTLGVLWKMQNHDYSSSVTGSTVFDFEGDGIAEVVYADECWLWVFDGPTGNVRLAWPHTSFTGTEASMLADIDGDGHAEMLIVSNGIDPTDSGWKCTQNETTPVNGQLWKPGPVSNGSYRGLLALGDSADSWVGTRTLWTEHTYHVTNVCDDTDNACSGANTYGSIPTPEVSNWSLPWLNDFRQNVQDKGIFNAPDAVVAMAVDCVDPPVAHVSVRNVGQAGLPAGVEADVYTSGLTKVGTVVTTYPLLPGQTQTLTTTLGSPATSHDTFLAQIYVDPTSPKFHECNENNDTSNQVKASCSQ